MRLRRYSRPLRRHIYPTDQALTTNLPSRPAALRLFGSGGVAWAIGLDFDPKGHSAATVAEHAADAARLFARLGGRAIVDTATSGGRHVWVPLSVPMTLRQAHQLAHACRRLWPTLDISPTVNLAEGCLTGPGSRCKDGRYRTLVTPFDQAVQAVTRRSAHDLVDRALTLLAELVGPIDPADVAARPTTTTPTGGARRPLSPSHTHIAEHGIWPTDRTTAHGQPWTRSEACYAVLCAAARRGYTIGDVLDRIETGQWPGLLTLYTGRYRHHWRRRLQAEWTKARTAAATAPSTHPTQAPQNTGGDSRESTERDFARRWLATITPVADQLVPGRARHNTHALLWSLAWLAWRTGRRHIEAGTRSYARGCAGLLDHSTAAALLAHLRELPDDQRPIRRISSGRGTHGDLYELVIPPAYALDATDPATHPDPRPIPAVFGVRDPDRPHTKLLGATGWRVYQALTSGATGTAAQIARAAGVSRAETYTVLPILTRLKLARKIDTSTLATASGCGATWQVGEQTTEQAGGDVDAPGHLSQLDKRHQAERAHWRQVLAAYAERRNQAIDRSPEPDEPLWWPPGWTTEPPEPGADTPGQPHGVDAHQQEPPAVEPGDAHDDETAAITLLTAVFGARLIPQQRVAAPKPSLRWLVHTGRKQAR
ncbi:hypothetical protein QTQ03_28385 [Micromonospora sp. WMMA1363]|uniref:hypothetical protein n=1 Tax=Micromonospora sp. WMMA1363 TaxID=3053985 RepID=UPI00259CCFFD|nr:hypothetical protein [Micromonospora sp. WMMA1363]MDM4723326.1 hypothetical protein [Micromonospora sp. WMMA1363]